MAVAGAVLPPEEPKPKTPAEHLSFLQDLAALKIAASVRWARDESRPVSAVLVERTFLVNLTVWHDGHIFDYVPEHPADEQGWHEFLRTADRVVGSGGGEADIVALLPDPSSRVERDLADLHDPVDGLAAQPSSLRADVAGEAMSIPGAPGRWLEIHMANNRYPLSFLARPEWLDEDLARLVAAAGEGGFTGLATTSWLNDHPAWLAHFPDVWRQRRIGGQPIGPHLGWWGQVLTARQTLAMGPAEVLRRTGRFRYQMLTSWASLQELARQVGGRGRLSVE